MVGVWGNKKSKSKSNKPNPAMTPPLTSNPFLTLAISSHSFAHALMFLINLFLAKRHLVKAFSVALNNSTLLGTRLRGCEIFIVKLLAFDKIEISDFSSPNFDATTQNNNND